MTNPSTAPFGVAEDLFFFDEQLNADVGVGEWKIDVDRLPEQFRKYAEEIGKVFNENVEYGCCGGCI